MFKIFFIMVVGASGMMMMTWELLMLTLSLSLGLVLMIPITSNSVVASLGMLSLSNLSFLLSILTVLTFFWAMGYSSYMTTNKSSSILLGLIMVLIFVLYLFFWTSKILIFYVAFELSILPIFLIILGWGYQSERISASLSMMFYTLTASMPLLAVLLYTQHYFSILHLATSLSFSSSNLNPSSFFVMVFFLLAFAVKLPMFGVHLWLPKAHVEAPVLGSMILAAILLKLGSYGLWVFIQMFHPAQFTNIWVSVSLVGATLVSVLCLRLSDLKMIIAYSSVGHMGLLMAALSMNNTLGALGSLMIMLAHGATSSAMFLMAFLMYQASGSRSLLLTKGILGWTSVLPLMWFLILMANMAAPPSYNLAAELLIIVSLSISSKLNILLVIAVILIGTSYVLVIYSSTSQGSVINFHSMAVTTQISTLSIFNHLVWSFLMIVATEVVSV